VLIHKLSALECCWIWTG